MISRNFFSLFFSVPVHKVDDITHVNFSDRDHLWFDPNWKSGSAVSRYFFLYTIQNVHKKFRQIDFYLISRDFLKAWFWHGLFSI